MQVGDYGEMIFEPTDERLKEREGGRGWEGFGIRVRCRGRNGSRVGEDTVQNERTMREG